MARSLAVVAALVFSLFLLSHAATIRLPSEGKDTLQPAAAGAADAETQVVVVDPTRIPVVLGDLPTDDDPFGEFKGGEPYRRRRHHHHHHMEGEQVSGDMQFSFGDEEKEMGMAGAGPVMGFDARRMGPMGRHGGGCPWMKKNRGEEEEGPNEEEEGDEDDDEEEGGFWDWVLGFFH